MPQETMTAADIVAYLTQNRYAQEQYIGAPWTLVAHANGEQLAEKYKSEQPKKALAALEISDPSAAAHLKECHEALKLLQKFNGENAGKGTAVYDAFRAENPGIDKKVAEYISFTYRSATDFRPADFPDDDLCLGNDCLGLIKYGLFVNEETGERLVTMRRPLQLLERDESHPQAAVEQALLPADMPQEQVLIAAHDIWTRHMLHQIRFSPFTDPMEVKAMDEAERLRDAFAKSADPARPERGLFAFFPAFRRAYGGEDGFFRALDDIFGADGNQKFLEKSGVRRGHWGGYAEGAELGAKYDVHSGHFVELYEKMGDADRKDFKAAFEKFVDTALPAMAAQNIDAARSTVQNLALIKVAVEHGSGALQAANHLHLYSRALAELQNRVNGSHKKFLADVPARKPGW